MKPASLLGQPKPRPFRPHFNDAITTELVIALIKRAAVKGAMLAQQDVGRERMEEADAKRSA